MSVRRALVHCAVLSLQDTCVFYPCCKCCFSRVDIEQQDTTRYRCCKCGYRYLGEQVEYRYRLSFRVTRDRCIFGVTVFGNSLNPFFGIHASGLQKLVEIEPSTRSTLLIKAVKDCFIGRRFIFGIKLSGTENGCLFEGLRSKGSNFRDTSQFTANQMILPKTTSLAGCTVVRYYQSLLRKASESESDCSKAGRLSASPLLLIPSQSQNSSFSDSTLFPSGFLSQPLLRSKHQDDTLSPTPPWQQSLGLVTSSAEQEDDYSTQANGDENIRHNGNSSTSFPAERGCPKSHQGTEEKTPLLPLEHSDSSVRNIVRNSLSVNNWCRLSQPAQKSSSLTQREFYIREKSRTFSSSSLVWEDLPFSESLAEFLDEENKNVDDETGMNLDANNENKIPKTFLENNELAVGSASVSQRKVKTGTSHSPRLLDVTNAPSAACETPVKCRNMHERRKSSSDEFNQEDNDSSLCYEEAEEERHEGDSYNCSADLFGNTFTISMNTEMLNVETEILKTNTGKLFSNTDRQHLINKSTCDVSHVTPRKQEEKETKCSLILQETHDFEFVPPSQSTPVVKVHLTQSPFFKNISIKENLTHSRTFSRQRHRLVPEAKFRRQDKHKTHLQVGQHVNLQRRNLNLESMKILNPKHDLQASDMTFFNLEDDEGIVAPTPAGKTHPSMLLGRRRHVDINCSDEKGRVDGKRCVLDQALTSSGFSRKGDFGSEAAFETTLDGSNGDDESQTPDWSRDLFSDSI